MKSGYWCTYTQHTMSHLIKSASQHTMTECRGILEQDTISTRTISNHTSMIATSLSWKVPTTTDSKFSSSLTITYPSISQCLSMHLGAFPFRGISWSWGRWSIANMWSIWGQVMLGLLMYWCHSETEKNMFMTWEVRKGGIDCSAFFRFARAVLRHKSVKPKAYPPTYYMFCFWPDISRRHLGRLN